MLDLFLFLLKLQTNFKIIIQAFTKKKDAELPPKTSIMQSLQQDMVFLAVSLIGM